jgi:hypothetical protein
LLHPPQFIGSLSMSAQEFAHTASGELHVKPHMDVAHVATPPVGAMHCFEQMPQ